MNIFKKAVMVFFLVTVTMSAYSLDFSYGVKGGPVFSRLNGDNSKLQGFDEVIRVGFTMGGFARISHEDILGVQPEILFTMKGSDFKNDETDQEVKLLLFYIEMPILFSVSYPLPLSYHLAPKLFAGPSLGIHLFSSKDVNDLDLDIKTFDLGLALGVGLDVRNLSIEVKYNRGLTSISGDLENEILSLTLGVPLKNRK
jgi:hypothetical protein